MTDSTKYLIHVDVSADGVVERSDVVGAIFGQTEGLLGSDLSLHDLQQASKVGRIDVSVNSARGVSTGEITIATSMDKVETAVLAAALETIDRVGPCRADLTVSRIEDVRAGTRREVVERAYELLSTVFDESVMSSEELLESVRERIRVEDIVEYEGYPAGPRVTDSDAIIIVEGRADVLTLLQYGIKNAVGVEGTSIPKPIAELTHHRTTTAFLDGDRGGELIFKELVQVGDIDAVAFAPPGRSVEDLSRGEILTALHQKTPVTKNLEITSPGDFHARRMELEDQTTPLEVDELDASTVGNPSPSRPAIMEHPSAEREEQPVSVADDEPKDSSDEIGADRRNTLLDHVREIIEENSEQVRFLDNSFRTIDEGDRGEAFDRLESIENIPHTVILDGNIDQKVLDIAAQRGVAQLVGRTRGEFTKQPMSVRVRTVAEFRTTAE